MFPNHPLANRRQVCGSPLLKRLNISNGRVEYRPRYFYAYQPLKSSLQQLLLRPGFSAKLESWRCRSVSESMLSDVFDGNVWKEFGSEKYNEFLTFKRNYGVIQTEVFHGNSGIMDEMRAEKTGNRTQGQRLEVRCTNH